MMPGLATDTYGPIKRQREKVAALEARAFKLRREIEDAKRELARLEAVSTTADQETA